MTIEFLAISAVSATIGLLCYLLGRSHGDTDRERLDWMDEHCCIASAGSFDTEQGAWTANGWQIKGWSLECPAITLREAIDRAKLERNQA